MRRRTTVPLALSVCLVVSLAAGACADEADPDDPAGGGAGAGAGTATVSAGLAALPRAAEQQTVVWGDVARAAELAGVERPAVDDPDEVTDYVMAITGQRVDAPAGGARVAVLVPNAGQVTLSARADEFEAEVGWGLAQVDTFVERQTPPEDVTLMDGEFDDDRLAAALGEPADGPWVLGDPEGSLSPEEVSVARPLGETLYLARAGDGLVVSGQVDATDEVVAAVDGEPDGPTLAEDAPLAAAAAALDDAGAYGALLVSPGLGGAGLSLGGPEASLAVSDQCLPAAMTATATGITEDDGPVMLAVLVHDSADAAAANAEALERLVAEGTSAANGRPWSEIVSADGVEVTGADDEVVVGRLRLADDVPARLWSDLPMTRDGLVSSC